MKTRILSADEWVIAREQWESGRVKTLAQLDRIKKVKPGSSKRHSRRDKWKRHAKTVEELGPGHLPPSPEPEKEAPAADRTPEEDDASNRRAVMRRQAGEWNVPRALLRSAMKLDTSGKIASVDHARLYAAAAAAQALTKIQQGERAAMGIVPGANDNGGGGPLQMTVLFQNQQTLEQVEAARNVVDVAGKVTLKEADPLAGNADHQPREIVLARQAEPGDDGIMVGGAVEQLRRTN